MDATAGEGESTGEIRWEGLGTRTAQRFLKEQAASLASCHNIKLGIGGVRFIGKSPPGFVEILVDACGGEEASDVVFLDPLEESETANLTTQYQRAIELLQNPRERRVSSRSPIVIVKNFPAVLEQAASVGGKSLPGQFLQAIKGIGPFRGYRPMVLVDACHDDVKRREIFGQIELENIVVGSSEMQLPFDEIKEMSQAALEFMQGLERLIDQRLSQDSGNTVGAVFAKTAFLDYYMFAAKELIESGLLPNQEQVRFLEGRAAFEDEILEAAREVIGQNKLILASNDWLEERFYEEIESLGAKVLIVTSPPFVIKQEIDYYGINAQGQILPRILKTNNPGYN